MTGARAFNPALLVHLFYFGVVLPWRTWKYRNVWPATGTRRPRVERYRANASQFLLHAAMSLATLLFLPRMVRIALFPMAWPSAWSFALGALACAVIVAIDLTYQRRCFDRDLPHVHLATPQTRDEQRWWIVHSAAAAVGEELTWRGVQPAIITLLTGEPWLAVAICVATFGIGHVRQGTPFIFIAAFFAAIFQVLTWLTGGLYVPMLVHAFVNIIVGLRGGAWANRRA